MSKYHSQQTLAWQMKYDTFPSIDIFNSRLSPCQFVFIIFENQNPPNYRITHWLQISIDYHHYFTEGWGNARNHYFLKNTNAVITLVTDRPMSELLPYLLKQICTTLPCQIFIIEAQSSRYFKICSAPQVKTYQDLNNSNLRIRCLPQIYLNGGNYIDIVDKLESKWEEWCIVKSPEQELIVATDKSNQMYVKRSILQLALDIFSTTNLTLTNTKMCKHKRHVQLKFTEANPPAWWVEMAINKNEVTLIFTDVEGYQFLTCHAEPYISFYFYLTPFQTEVWVALGVSICTIVAIMVVVHNFVNQKEKQPFSPWMFVLATIFEEGGFIPSKLEKSTFFRILLGIWSIMSVTLTNGYNGIMISELNSPLQLARPEKFDDLICQSGGIYSDQAQIREQSWRNLTQFFMLVHEISFGGFNSLQYRTSQSNGNDKCYKLLSVLQRNTWVAELPEFLSSLFELANKFLWSRLKYLPHLETFKVLDLFNVKHSFYPSGITQDTNASTIKQKIEREVVQCGKSVFMARSSELHLENKFLSRKYLGTKFFISDDVVQRFPSGIAFQFALRSRVVKGFKNVVDAGIWTHVEKEELGRKNVNRSQVVVMKQSNIVLTNIATLSGSLPTVFILASGFICVAIFVFIIECRSRIGPFIRNIRYFYLAHRRKCCLKSASLQSNTSVVDAVGR
ncbi:hypothetical protein Fcan01_26789 [Folsomia candida]|uniref:Uncharacterized protein n=1 Tax=Folsomia candida TaxID=158441 RepID=A0A226D0V7_FOLCA|nr:hypothetical protein Fcan01_26789 [Folsomia candida]